MDGKKTAKAAGIEPWEDAGARCATLDPCVDLYLYSNEINGADPEPPIVSVFPVEVKSLADRYPEAGERRGKWSYAEKAESKMRELDLKAIVEGLLLLPPAA